jgi:hypothetical protein
VVREVQYSGGYDGPRVPPSLMTVPDLQKFPIDWLVYVFIKLTGPNCYDDDG